MKNALLPILLAFILFSCGNGSSDEAKKMYSAELENSIGKFSKAVDEYCACVAEKGVDACNDLHGQLMDERAYVESMITSSVEAGTMDKKEDVDKARNRVKELFDKKAGCAQEGMKQ
jgi:hypothetical protein